MRAPCNVTAIVSRNARLTSAIASDGNVLTASPITQSAMTPLAVTAPTSLLRLDARAANQLAPALRVVAQNLAELLRCDTGRLGALRCKTLLDVRRGQRFEHAVSHVFDDLR